MPAVAAATLPNDLFVAPRTAGAVNNVLYRVNAAGPALPAARRRSATGPPTRVWSAAATPPTGAPPSRGTPRCRRATPADVFATERWGEQDWNFPVAAGRNVTVRLYFTNQYDGTSKAGQRVFNVLVDGVTRLSNFDIVAAAGNRIGTMRAFAITTDADGVDVDLRAVTENPLVNGIEIVDNADRRPTAAPAAPGRGRDGSTDGPAQRRQLDDGLVDRPRRLPAQRHRLLRAQRRLALQADVQQRPPARSARSGS